MKKIKKKRNYLEKKFPTIKIIKDTEAIFNDKKINLVSIASFDNYHYPQIIKCIKKNKNIIAEKPICLNKKQLKKIYLELKRNRKVKMITNLVLRSNGLFKKFKEKIDLKELFYIEADYIWGRKQKLFEWRSKIKDYSIMLGAAIHMIDIVMWLTKLKPISVTSFGSSKITKKTNFKKNNLIVSIFKFPKDIIVKISANAGALYDHFHEIKIFQKNSTLVNSRLGSYSYDSYNKNLMKKFKNSLYPDKKNRKKIIQNFIKEILLKKTASITLKEQIDLMSVCLAADDAFKKKKEVVIKYL